MSNRSDVDTGVEPAWDETDHRFTRRRLVRWVTVLTVGIVTVLAVWQDTLV